MPTYIHYDQCLALSSTCSHSAICCKRPATILVLFCLLETLYSKFLVGEKMGLRADVSQPAVTTAFEHTEQPSAGQQHAWQDNINDSLTCC